MSVKMKMITFKRGPHEKSKRGKKKRLSCILLMHFGIGLNTPPSKSDEINTQFSKNKSDFGQHFSSIFTLRETEPFYAPHPYARCLAINDINFTKASVISLSAAADCLCVEGHTKANTVN